MTSLRKNRRWLLLVGAFLVVLLIGTRTGWLLSRDNENQITQNDGQGYSIDEQGKVTVSYRDGQIEAAVPLKVDMTGNTLGMGKENIGFFVSEEKTAVVYGFADGKASMLHVLLSSDKGETWEDYAIPASKGYETKFIGFTSQSKGWLVSGASEGVGRAVNYLYQTSDGGKTWEEIGNPNDQYAEHLTGVGFANENVGFLGYRYYMDNGPVIYWTQDRGKSWERLLLTFPASFDHYKMNPLSPTFNGKNGRLPIELIDPDKETVDTVELFSKDGGLTWIFMEK
ncbi:hypothetical protein [Gorillibacterium sp. CAU 1737]|uniref:WD40/YVTN/BNR-like repeat-containing protein n=1 Tax=Gorillibacterium sp. CAU 1737 TaxID=3140362 RepID=UPI003261A008